MTQDQLAEIQALSWKWAKFAGFDKLSNIETQIALNKEIAEAWESRNNREELIKELTDICLILVRSVKVNCLNARVPRLTFPIAKEAGELIMQLMELRGLDIKLKSLIQYCQQNNIGLYNHCKLKLRYNYTRPEYIAKNKELNK